MTKREGVYCAHTTLLPLCFQQNKLVHKNCCIYSFVKKKILKNPKKGNYIKKRGNPKKGKKPKKGKLPIKKQKTPKKTLKKRKLY